MKREDEEANLSDVGLVDAANKWLKSVNWSNYRSVIRSCSVYWYQASSRYLDVWSSWYWWNPHGACGGE